MSLTKEETELAKRLKDRKDFAGRVAKTVLRVKYISVKQKNVLLRADAELGRGTKAGVVQEDTFNDEQLQDDRDLCDSLGISPWGRDSD